MQPTTDSPLRPCTGDDVLDWLRTPAARAAASRLVQQRRLPGGAAMVEDLLADSTLAMLRRMRSARPLEVESPAAYGRAVLRSVVRQHLGGRDLSLEVSLDVVDEPAEATTDWVDPTAGDEARVLIEHLGSREAWLTSAALTYVTLLMYPDATPESLPSPKAGATVDQARCWPALWLAGERDVFPIDGDDSFRRTRARRITKVIDRVQLAFATLLLRSDRSTGHHSPDGSHE